MATKYDITIDEGTSFYNLLTWKDDADAAIDITGYAASFVITDGNQIKITATSSNGKITLGGAAGTIIIQLSVSDLAVLARGKYQYKLTLDGGATSTFRLIEGAVTVS